MTVMRLLFVKSVFLVLTERRCRSIFVSMVNVMFGCASKFREAGKTLLKSMDQAREPREHAISFVQHPLRHRDWEALSPSGAYSGYLKRTNGNLRQIV